MRKILFLLIIAITALATGCGPYGGPMHGSTYGGPGMQNAGWWGLGGIGMIIIWVLIAAIIVFVLWKLAGGGWRQDSMKPPGQSALDILKERYAKGEITREEYEQMRKDIEV